MYIHLTHLSSLPACGACWWHWQTVCTKIGPEVIKLFSCSTQLSTKFQLLIKTKIPTNDEFFALSLSDVVFIMLNVKMPTIVGILTLMSRINFKLSWVEHGISFITSGQGPTKSLAQGTKIFQYCTCPAGRVTYNFHLSCKHMHLPFKSVCNKEHKGVIWNMTSSSNSSQALVQLEECFVKNYSSFLDFTHNYERTSGIFVPWSGRSWTKLFDTLMVFLIFFRN